VRAADAERSAEKINVGASNGVRGETMTVQSSDDQPVPEAAIAGTEVAGAAEADRIFSLLRQKAEELVASGIREGHARGLAQLELRIAQWPSEWDDDLLVLLYGDSDAPPAELDFPDLGITIEPEEVTTSFIKSAMCVLKARVKFKEKSVKALVDAAARINTLLGVLAVLNWGNCGSGWWSHVTHGSMGGVVPNLELGRVQNVVAALRKLPEPVARKVRAALYWIREPRQLLMEGHRSDVLRVYAGYWNAFECLVEAVCLLCPQSKMRRAEKQAGIDAFVAKRNGKLDAAAISECYRAFVDPGFVAKASHALAVCFPYRADQYVAECFRMKPEKDRLYNIRNAINHGDIDAENPNELLRVEDRHSRLWMIVFGILGLILPIDRPLDQQ
jgi:hypothetical protein